MASRSEDDGWDSVARPESYSTKRGKSSNPKSSKNPPSSAVRFDASSDHTLRPDQSDYRHLGQSQADILNEFKFSVDCWVLDLIVDLFVIELNRTYDAGSVIPSVLASSQMSSTEWPRSIWQHHLGTFLNWITYHSDQGAKWKLISDVLVHGFRSVVGPHRGADRVTIAMGFATITDWRNKNGPADVLKALFPDSGDTAHRGVNVLRQPERHGIIQRYFSTEFAELHTCSEFRDLGDTWAYCDYEARFREKSRQTAQQIRGFVWPLSHGGPAGPDRHTLPLRVPWDPVKLARHLEQIGEKPTISQVLTLSGNFRFPYAQTCAGYVCRTWPDVGPEILAALDEMVSSTMATGQVLSESEMPKTRFTRSELLGVDEDCTVIVRFESHNSSGLVFEGTVETAIHVVQVFSWLAAALPEPESTVHRESELILYAATTNLIVETTGVTIKTEGYLLRLSPHASQCWAPAMNKCTIAVDFPIPIRSGGKGLQIPLQFIVSIIGATRVTTYRGGLIVKGYGGVLVAVKQTGHSLQWHLTCSDDLGSPIPISKVLQACQTADPSFENRFRDLSILRFLQDGDCFVGWCPKAIVRAGNNPRELDYEAIRKSGCSAPRAGTVIKSITVGFQQIATLEIEFGFSSYQSTFYHQMKRRRYAGVVRQAERARILLYDVGTRRSWLLNATDVIMHMVQYRLWHSPVSDDLGSETTFELLQRKPAAETMLKNGKHMIEDGYSLQEMIMNTWEVIERLQVELIERRQAARATPRIGRSRQLGFEFVDCADEASTFTILESPVLGDTFSSLGWPQLIEGDNTLTLFGNGFGELIQPQDTSTSSGCRQWRTLPQKLDLLATTTGVMRSLYEEQPSNDASGDLSASSKHYLTPHLITWYCGEALFDPCPTPNGHCRCNRVQILKPRSIIRSGRNSNTTPPELPPSGAVVFGDPKRFKQFVEVDLSESLSTPIQLHEKLEKTSLSEKQHEAKVIAAAPSLT